MNYYKVSFFTSLTGGKVQEKIVTASNRVSAIESCFNILYQPFYMGCLDCDYTITRKYFSGNINTRDTFSVGCEGHILVEGELLFSCLFYKVELFQNESEVK